MLPELKSNAFNTFSHLHFPIRLVNRIYSMINMILSKKKKKDKHDRYDVDILKYYI